ncbi:hypothetical protein TUN199_10789 [Pyrenophora tritici-repentis]|nr:hypothetical protein TUN199_10789 [Pyrenophora tritici-repentis]
MRQRDCDQIWPSSLNTNGYTSIVLSFAIFNSITFEVGMKRPEDEEVYNQFFKLPASIYKGIAIGEWAMSHRLRNNQFNPVTLLDPLTYLGRA